MNLNNRFNGTALTYELVGGNDDYSINQSLSQIGNVGIQNITNLIDVDVDDTSGFWGDWIAILGSNQTNQYQIQGAKLNQKKMPSQYQLIGDVLYAPNLTCFDLSFFNGELLIYNCGQQNYSESGSPSNFSDILGVVNMTNGLTKNLTIPNQQNYTSVNQSYVETWDASFNGINQTGLIFRGYPEGNFTPANASSSIEMFEVSYDTSAQINISFIGSLNSTQIPNFQLVSYQVNDDGTLYLLDRIRGLFIYNITQGRFDLIQQLNTSITASYLAMGILQDYLSGSAGYQEILIIQNSTNTVIQEWMWGRNGGEFTHIMNYSIQEKGLIPLGNDQFTFNPYYISYNSGNKQYIWENFFQTPNKMNHTILIYESLATPSSFFPMNPTSNIILGVTVTQATSNQLNHPYLIVNKPTAPESSNQITITATSSTLGLTCDLILNSEIVSLDESSPHPAYTPSKITEPHSLTYPGDYSQDISTQFLGPALMYSVNVTNATGFPVLSQASITGNQSVIANKKNVRFMMNFPLNSYNLLYTQASNLSLILQTCNDTQLTNCNHIGQNQLTNDIIQLVGLSIFNLSTFPTASSLYCLWLAKTQSVQCFQQTQSSINNPAFNINIPTDLSLWDMATAGQFIYLTVQNSTSSLNSILVYDVTKQQIVQTINSTTLQLTQQSDFQPVSVSTDYMGYGTTLFVNNNNNQVVLIGYTEFDLVILNVVKFPTQNPNQQAELFIDGEYMYVVCAQDSASTVYTSWIAEYLVSALAQIRFLKYLPKYNAQIAYPLNIQYNSAAKQVFVPVVKGNQNYLFVYHTSDSALNSLYHAIPYPNVNNYIYLSVDSVGSSDILFSIDKTKQEAMIFQIPYVRQLQFKSNMSSVRVQSDILLNINISSQLNPQVITSLHSNVSVTNDFTGIMPNYRIEQQYLKDVTASSGNTTYAFNPLYTLSGQILNYAVECSTGCVAEIVQNTQKKVDNPTSCPLLTNPINTYSFYYKTQDSAPLPLYQTRNAIFTYTPQNTCSQLLFWDEFNIVNCPSLINIAFTQPQQFLQVCNQFQTGGLATILEYANDKLTFSHGMQLDGVVLSSDVAYGPSSSAQKPRLHYLVVQYAKQLSVYNMTSQTLLANIPVELTSPITGFSLVDISTNQTQSLFALLAVNGTVSSPYTQQIAFIAFTADTFKYSNTMSINIQSNPQIGDQKVPSTSMFNGVQNLQTFRSVNGETFTLQVLYTTTQSANYVLDLTFNVTASVFDRSSAFTFPVETQVVSFLANYGGFMQQNHLVYDSVDHKVMLVYYNDGQVISAIYPTDMIKNNYQDVIFWESAVVFTTASKVGFYPTYTQQLAMIGQTGQLYKVEPQLQVNIAFSGTTQGTLALTGSNTYQSATTHIQVTQSIATNSSSGVAWWGWLLISLGIVIVLGGVGYFVYRSRKREELLLH